MRLLNRLIILLAATSLAGACGGSTSGDSDKGVPIDDLPEMLVGAYCGQLETCLGPLLPLFLPGEDCDSAFGPAFADELPGLKAAIDNGRVHYDGRHVQACIDAISALGCDLATTRVFEACEDALDGTVAVGGDCAMDQECEGSAYCKFSTTCPGKCTTLEGAGGLCDRDDQCANKLLCSDMTGHCVEPAQVGETCGGGGAAPPCVLNLLCAGSNDMNGTTGTCTATDDVLVRQDGESCDILGGTFCVSGEHCIIDSVDVTTGTLNTTCGPGVASGAACKAALPDVCPIDEYCAAPQNSFDGICTPKPVAGEACVKPALGGNVTLCAPNLRCDGGTCRERQHLGGSCAGNDVCYSDQCVNGTCTAKGVCAAP